ncbi:MAG: C40 family peptidase [Actinobacteria bacterium]|nr:C40 family peptidase [Actinomycetota bacterium]
MTGPATRRIWICAAAVLVTLFAVSPAAADPIGSKRAQAEAVMGQIQLLDASVGKAAEEFNSARIRLDEIVADQRRNERHLKIARASYGKAQQALQARLLALYTSESDSSGFEILLGAENLSDLLSRVDTVKRVSKQDARVVREIRAFRVEVKRREEELKDARAEQEGLVGELAAKRREIESQLAERRVLLASIETDIERIQAEERRRQERLISQARQRIRSSGSGGASTSPGSSGGSAPESSSGGTSSGGTTSGGSAPPPRYGGVVGIAMRYLGVPYRWGGASPGTGFDCSGFIMYVYAQVGVSLPHNAAMQYGYGSPVSRSELAPGDLVFFDGLGHNGMYIGGGQFIHSPHTGDVVKISSLGDSWYASTYVGARRL